MNIRVIQWATGGVGKAAIECVLNHPQLELAGWVYPDLNNPRHKAVADAAVEGGVTLHGSGIHPGGITERFPLMLSSLSSAVTHVRAEEFSDIRTYNAPDVVRHIMGFGGTPAEAVQ